MRILLTALLTAMAGPAFAASENGFVSLGNTDFIVLIAFLCFVALLVYMKVPGKVASMLDDRAAGIRSDLDEARSLRDEAKALLASYERKQKEVQEQANRIVANAKDEAAKSAESAKAEIQSSVARRLAGAEEQIAAAQAAAIKDIRNQAVTVAIAAAKDIMAQQMDASRSNALIDDAITQVGEKLH